MTLSFILKIEYWKSSLQFLENFDDVFFTETFVEIFLIEK